MKILNIEIKDVEELEDGYGHWVAVTYQAPILKNQYTLNLFVTMYDKVDVEVITYIVKELRYRELVRHSLDMYELEKEG